MSLVDRYREGLASSKPSTFACEHYSPLSGSKRCAHYQPGGRCARIPNGKCVEWLKVNAPAEQPPKPTFALTHPTSPRVPDSPPSPHEAPGRGSPRPTAACACGITAADIASFRDLRMEVCLETDAGEIWLVPEYSKRPRVELSPTHVAFMVHVLRAFPGARVRSVSRLFTNNQEKNR